MRAAFLLPWSMVFHLLFLSQNLYAWQGIAVHSTPKYKKGFKHLKYASANAQKGGTLTIGWSGNFDTLNGFSPKGIAPLLLNDLVFQQLGQSTLDEPLSQYPQIASNFTLAKDKLSMIFDIDRKAVFADGKAITADDVKFSFDLFKSNKVNAFYNTYWSDIKEVKIVNKHRLKFIFKQVNSELPATATQITILPRHFYSKGKFESSFSGKALGSGPYFVKDFKRGSHIVYQKNPKFWAANSPFNQGRYNFDTITVKYYKDSTAQVEAFKKGEFDIYICYSSKVWAKDMMGKKFTTWNWIKKELWKHNNNQGSQGFYFNLRKKIFSDVKVREAISLAFDFPWTNKTLFYGQYVKNRSFFENSPLKASSTPNGKEAEFLKKLQSKFPKAVPDSVFKINMSKHFSEKKLKKRLKQARRMLMKAGYTFKNGVMTAKDGSRLDFEFLLSSPMMGRVVEPFIKNLNRIGVKVRMSIKEPSVYQRKLIARDFDMVVLSIGQSQSPGNEQIDLWHSNSADQKYARNHAGLKNSAVDHLIDKMVYAKSRKDLVFYTKILDRLLFSLHITVHNWHITSHRIALWDKFAKPQHTPSYYNAFQMLEFLWQDKNKASRLQQAIKAKKAI